MNSKIAWGILAGILVITFSYALVVDHPELFGSALSRTKSSTYYTDVSSGKVNQSAFGECYQGYNTSYLNTTYYYINKTTCTKYQECVTQTNWRCNLSMPVNATDRCGWVNTTICHDAYNCTNVSTKMANTTKINTIFYYPNYECMTMKHEQALYEVKNMTNVCGEQLKTCLGKALDLASTKNCLIIEANCKEVA